MAQFWIQVSKEYVDANLDALINYLDDADRGEARRDTLRALKDRVNDLMAEAVAMPFWQMPEWSARERLLRIRIVAAYLVVADDDDRSKPLALLCYMLAGSPVVSDAQRSSLVALAVKVISGHKVERLGFGLPGIPPHEANLPMFATRVLSVGLETVRSCVTYYEKKGCLYSAEQGMALSAMARPEYIHQDGLGRLTCAHELMGLRLMLNSNDMPRRLESFADWSALAHDFLMAQRNVRPTPPPVAAKKKVYQIGDPVTVRVLNVRNGYMNSITVDPDYEVMRGSFYFSTGVVPGYSLQMMSERVNNLLLKGETLYVEVERQEHKVTPFIVNKVFEDFYYASAENLMEDGQLCLACAIDYTAVGNTWLTEHGIQVFVPEDNYEDRTGQMARLRLTNVSFVEGEIRGEIESEVTVDKPVKREFVANARNMMLDEFLLSCKGPRRADASQAEPLDKGRVSLMARMIYENKVWVKTPVEQFQRVALARMLLTLIERTIDTQYLKLVMDYERALVAFAQNRPVSPLAAAEDLLTLALPEVREKCEVVKELCRFDALPKEPEPDLTKLLPNAEVKDLVTLHNHLNGLSAVVELDKVKRMIVRKLDVEAEYVSIVADKTDYGNELTTREFKSSIVYPPNNHMQPDHQKQLRAILRTVVGLLNSDKGGDLYIGVNDTTQKAIPGQLARDMEWLYLNHKITEQSLDKYRLYLKYRIDEAFKEESGSARGMDITASRVDLIPEQSREGVDVLHIAVKPYEYDIVVFDPGYHPDQQTTYMRTSGSTVPMDEDMKIQCRIRKSRLGGPNMTMVHALEQAKRERRQVVLRGYRSHNQTKDRLVEAYYIVSRMDIVICYDLEAGENRVYKISRIGSLETTDNTWCHQLKYRTEPKFDIFGMMDQEGLPAIRLKLRLKNYAKTLLMEEYPKARRLEEKLLGIEDRLVQESGPEETWLLDIHVNKLEGVGRFYLGMAPYIEIVEGDALKAYVREYIGRIAEQLAFDC